MTRTSSISAVRLGPVKIVIAEIEKRGSIIMQITLEDARIVRFRRLDSVLEILEKLEVCG
jgi:hypothetical protein